MHEFDSSLTRLASLPTPACLDLIDDAVIAGIATRRREDSFGKLATGVAGAFALLLGLVSAALSHPESAQAHTISPFSPQNPLAPSTLLDIHP